MIGETLDLLRRGVIALERIADALEKSREDWRCKDVTPGVNLDAIEVHLSSLEDSARTIAGRET